MMYRHNEFAREAVTSCLAVFRGQIERRLAGEITEDQFRPMRRTNGVYLRDHAYMLRISVPGGILSSHQLKVLAHVARLYDRGYAHFTADQNIEFRWPALADIPSALTDLATAGLFASEAGSAAIWESGNDRLADAAHSDDASVTVPLGGTRDLSASRMEALADLAETYGSGELHLGQDIVLPHIARADLPSVHAALATSGLDDRRHSDQTPSTEAHHAREAEAA
jgi:sulfite reductase beta subunit-like hemoprotein